MPVSKVRFYLRVVAAVLALIVVAAKSAVLAEWLPPDPTTEAIVLIAGGVLVFADSIGSIFASRHARAVEKRQAEVRSSVIGAVVSIAEATGLDLTELGASVFLVRRGRLPGREDHLVRLVRFRLNDTPQASTVLWTKDKAGVGKAWAQSRIVHEPLKALAEKYGSADVTEAGFARISSTSKRGFTHEEFRNIVGKYAEVLAVPILLPDDAHPRVIGVLSIDVPMTVEHASLGNTLTSKAVERVATTCAKTIGQMLTTA